MVSTELKGIALRAERFLRCLKQTFYEPFELSFELRGEMRGSLELVLRLAFLVLQLEAVGDLLAGELHGALDVVLELVDLELRLQDVLLATPLLVDAAQVHQQLLLLADQQ